MEVTTQIQIDMLKRVHGRKAKAEVKKKMIDAKCVQCDQPEEDGCRGCCKYHFRQFIYARNQDPEVRAAKTAKQRKDAKERFDDRQVKAGRIRASRRGRHSKYPNPFMERTA
jgi:hypothetical protein